MAGKRLKKFPKRIKWWSTFLGQASLLFQICECQFYKYSSAAESYFQICYHQDTNYFMNGFTKAGTKFAFYIDKDDPNKLTTLNVGGQHRIQMVSRGPDCFTYPNHDRPNRFGLVLEYDDSGGDHRCRVDR